ncbi:hypothetical protein AKJ16_DCAP06995, partial [Drosera capensis]
MKDRTQFVFSKALEKVIGLGVDNLGYNLLLLIAQLHEALVWVDVLGALGNPIDSVGIINLPACLGESPAVMLNQQVPNIINEASVEHIREIGHGRRHQLWGLVPHIELLHEVFSVIPQEAVIIPDTSVWLVSAGFHYSLGCISDASEAFTCIHITSALGQCIDRVVTVLPYSHIDITGVTVAANGFWDRVLIVFGFASSRTGDYEEEGEQQKARTIYGCGSHW